MSVLQHISTLRSLMKINQIGAIIIPSADPHQSEYVAEHWKSRQWISDFTGSSGVVLISQDHAGLWTDSRYFIQAEQQLNPDLYTLHKIYDRTSPGYSDWILKNLNDGETVAIDGSLISAKQYRNLKKKLSDKNISIKTDVDLISEIWHQRPSKPKSPAIHLPIKYSGKSTKEKLQELRKHLFLQKADSVLITTLDDIAWLLNIRSKDIDFNPVSIAYLLVKTNSCDLFIDRDKTEGIKDHLDANEIRIKDYNAITLSLREIKKPIIVNPDSCSIKLYETIPSDLIIEQRNLIEEQKAIKNETELNHFREVMVKDGVALANAFYWLMSNLKNGVTEHDFGQKIAACRSEQEGYFCESFPAIIGVNGNGAIVHYRAPENNSSIITNQGILLCDSGGQYFTGTTDITRTIALGEVTNEQKDCFTYVLKGFINLINATFPKGTKGVQLDTMAREALWNQGLNYLHGTGHGVGFFLNVHEGPQGFAPGSSSRGNYILKESMVTTVEPGYYKENEFGIRIENIVITIAADKQDYLRNESITLYPIDKNLINTELLNTMEIGWLNEYHQEVWDKLSPHLSQDVKDWLESQCSAL